MNKKQKRAGLIATIVGISAVAIGLVLVALNSTVAYFYTPTDLAALANPPQGIIRLGGLVANDSVAFSDDQEAEVRFVVEDGFEKISVRFAGVLPDLFREGQGVVVQGNITPEGELQAVEVLAKHDETYMPKEVADALKAQGRWQEGEAPTVE